MSASIALVDDEFIVAGKLNFATVVTLWNKSLPLLSRIKDIRMDLTAVTNSNGAGLALLVEWMRYAAKNHKKISFKNIPENLLSIAKVSGIAELIP